MQSPMQALRIMAGSAVVHTGKGWREGKEGRGQERRGRGEEGEGRGGDMFPDK